MKPQIKKIYLNVRALKLFEEINKESPAPKLAKLIAVLKRPLPDTRKNYIEVSPELVFDVIPFVITSADNKNRLQKYLLDSLRDVAKVEFQLDFTREELEVLCYEMIAQENKALSKGLSK